jgi:hypothetical protein
VDARCVRDIADDLTGVDVDDDDMGRVGDVEAARSRIDGEVIPAALAAYLDLAGEAITG